MNEEFMNMFGVIVVIFLGVLATVAMILAVIVVFNAMQESCLDRKRKKLEYKKLKKDLEKSEKSIKETD
ncbi:MAG: hypothetical protein HDR72_05475 [Ruminococcaceae bacterium]|nr:hypothetical protein [Oscillospiraceae bacterium]